MNSRRCNDLEMDMEQSLSLWRGLFFGLSFMAGTMVGKWDGIPFPNGVVRFQILRLFLDNKVYVEYISIDKYVKMILEFHASKHFVLDQEMWPPRPFDVQLCFHRLVFLEFCIQ